MDPRAPDTKPLPVVETVVAPAVPTPTTAMTAEAPLPPPPPRRRDLTPVVLGLLALAAVVALALSIMAFNRNGAPDAPNALFGPIEGYGKAQADLDKTVSRSLQVWLDTHPATKRGAFAALGAAVLLAARAAVRG